MKKHVVPLRVLCIALCGLLIIPFFPLSVSGTEYDGMEASQQISASRVAGMYHHMIANMEDGTSDWTSGHMDLCDVSDPNFVFDGSSALQVSGLTNPDQWQNVRYSFDEPCDWSEYSTFLYAVFVPAVGEGRYFTQMTLRTAESEFTRYCLIQDGTWNMVWTDISSFGERSAVTELEISVRYIPENEQQTNIAFSFYLDSVGLSRGTNLPRALQFLTPDYYVYGGTLNYGQGDDGTYMDFSLSSSAAEPFLETYTTEYTSFTGCDSLRLRFINASDCSGIRIYYTTGSTSSFTESNSVYTQISSGDQVQNLYFSLRSSDIRQIRIQFEGAHSGSLRFYAIEPVSYNASCVSGVGRINACVFSEDGQAVEISGTIPADTLARYRSATLQVYALLPGENPLNTDFDSLSSLASISAQGEFTIRIPDESHTYLCSAFAVVLLHTGGYTLIDDPVCITNPELLAHDTVSYSSFTVKKGLSSIDAWAQAQDLGTRYTVQQVPLEQLFTLTPQEEYAEQDGIRLYLNAQKLQELDDALRSAENSGINVYLQLTVSRTEDEALNALLLHPASTAADAECAFNTSTPDGVRTLRAISTFLASRYQNAVSGMIVGKTVDLAFDSYELGTLSLSDFADTYAAAFRIVYNAARSVNYGLRFYLPLSDAWDAGLDTCASSQFDAQAVTEAFALRISRQGVIPWHLYLTLTDTQNVTASAARRSRLYSCDLPYLCSYLADLRVRSGGSSVPTVILNDQGYTEDAASNAKRFVYAYLTVNTQACENIDAYLIPQHAMTAWTDLYQYIDTTDAQTYIDPLLAQFGVSSWNDLITGYTPGLFMRRSLQNTDLTVNYGEVVTGKVSLFHFATDTDGWDTITDGVTLRGGESYMDRSNTLFAVMRNCEENRYRTLYHAFPYPRDFSAAPVFSFDIAAVSLPSGVKEARIEVILTSGDDRITASGIIRSGVWTSFVLDARDFVGIRAVDSVRIRIVGEDGSDIGEPTLVLASVTANSYDHTTEYIQRVFEEERLKYTENDVLRIQPYVIRTLIAAAAICICILVIRAFHRFSKRTRRKPMIRQNDIFHSFHDR